MVNTTLIIGRFQPFTKAHFELASKQDGHVTIAVVRGADTGKSPFPIDKTVELIKRAIPNAHVIQAKTAWIGDIAAALEADGLKISTLIAGQDRQASYEAMLKRAKLDGVKLEAIPRSDDSVSGTKVREALMSGDYTAFKSMMPARIQDKRTFAELSAILGAAKQ